MPTPFTYDTPVEGYDGQQTSIDVHGHLDDTEVEAFLWEVERDPYGYTGRDEPGDTLCLAVEHLWRWSRPVGEDEEEDDGVSERFDYLSSPVKDATPITRFGFDEWGWDKPNCAYHPDLPSTFGMANNDGEPTYVCTACYVTWSDRKEFLARQLIAQHERLVASGIPDSHIWHTAEELNALGTPPPPTEPPREITIPAPHVPHGPHGVPPHHATADYLRSVVAKIDSGYAKVGGSSVTATVRQLLADAADALETQGVKGG